MTAHEALYAAKPWFKGYPPGNSTTMVAPPCQNLSELVNISAKRYGNKIAYTTCLDNGLTGSVSFNEVDLYSNHFAAYLRGVLGLQKGDRVAIQMPNGNAYPICAFGILKAGCILVNVNPLYTEHEMIAQFNDSGAQVLVIIDLFGDKLAHVIPKTGVKHVITVSVVEKFSLFPNLLVQTVLKIKKKLPKIDMPHVPLAQALAQGAQAYQKNPQAVSSSQIAAEDIAVLQYTGGTTGVAKGAMLTHKNLISNMCQLLAYADKQLRPGQEVILTALPLYHIFAFTVNNICCFYVGAHNILCPSPRPISNLRKAFEKFQITWLTGINTLFNALANEPWFQSNPPKLRVSIAGGAALHPAVAERWEKLVKTPLLEGYGLTESSPVLSFNPLEGEARLGTIGLPLPDTDIKIVDDNGVCVGLGEPGELIAKGPQIMKGYWQQPEETKKTLKDGWLYTGDVATMDKDGFFKIVDRKKEMILVSGFNVYPNEVEACLAMHPGVAEAAVIGVPDEKTGETVSAYVILKNQNTTKDDLREHCKKLLTGYKVPKHIEFRTELPKTPIGKILRKDLRAEVLGKK